MNIITLISPPGGGKGTLARALTKEYGFPVLEFSKRLNEDKDSDPSLASKFDEAKRQGTLLDDSVVIEKIKEWLKEPQYAGGVIIDGFPRTIPQAKALKDMLNEMGESVTLAVDIHFEKEEEEILFDRQRLRKQKAIEAGETPRVDDGVEETMRRRMAIYWQDTHPLNDFYEEDGVLHSVDGKLNPQDTLDHVSKKMREIGIDPLSPSERLDHESKPKP